MPEMQNISWLYSPFLVTTFSTWRNQLSPAQSRCTALLDPECTTPCMSCIQPSHLLPGLWLLAQDQLSDTWHDQAFVCPEGSWTLPIARAWASVLWLPLRSGRLDSKHMLCSGSVPRGDTGDTGVQPCYRADLPWATNPTANKKSINWSFSIFLCNLQN